MVTNWDELPLTLSVPLAASVVGVSRAHYYAEIRSGNTDLPFKKIGGRVVVPKSKLREFLEGGEH